MAKRNVHRIDDVLIRLGFLALAGVMFAVGCTETFEAAPSAWMPVAVGCGAIITLIIGYAIRRDDRRIVAVWQILDHSTEAHIEELAQATGFERSFLLRAVRTINRQPGAYYVWDEQAGTVIDGRMRSRVVMVERCESCGAHIHAELSMDLNAVPACAHCAGPITSRDLNRLKQENIQALREQTSKPVRQFSFWIFVPLIIIFWPAGVVYAVWTTGLVDELLGRVRAS